MNYHEALLEALEIILWDKAVSLMKEFIGTVVIVIIGLKLKTVWNNFIDKITT